jgi:CRP-like cAMP-binding protein
MSAQRPLRILLHQRRQRTAPRHRVGHATVPTAVELTRSEWLFKARPAFAKAAQGGYSRRIPLTQSEIGLMANASRKQVNAALARFAEAGWVKTDYRSIVIRDVGKLRRFARGEDRLKLRRPVQPRCQTFQKNILDSDG